MPVWAVLAIAQCLMLMGFGTGQTGFPRSLDRHVLDTPLAWSLAVHRSAAAVLMGDPAQDEEPGLATPETMQEAVAAAGFGGSGQRESRGFWPVAADDASELVREVVILTPDLVP